jgi:hypothetical protein
MNRIGIDLHRRLGTVDRRIFGQFIEHIGRCIYGGVYEEGSPLSDARGFRRDVLDAARPLRFPHLRWPGGNFVSGYHWRDGVGPVAGRQHCRAALQIANGRGDPLGLRRGHHGPRSGGAQFQLLQRLEMLFHPVDHRFRAEPVGHQRQHGPPFRLLRLG